MRIRCGTGFVVIAGLLGGSMATAGCGPRPPPPPATSLSAKPNFFLRSGFDQDPSSYVGRFIPDDATPATIDETAAMKLTCSQFFSIKRVPAGGVEYDEYFAASTAAAGQIGVSSVSAGASLDEGHIVRVHYRLTEKWIAELDDPAGFEACCKQAGDQCTGRIVGELIAGTGEIYSAGASNRGGTASGPGAEVSLRDGVEWHRQVKFDQPVFFAFKLTRNLYGGAGGAAADQCPPEWENQPPRSTQGQYFVGVSDWLESERVTRDQAMLDARRQLVRYLGEQIRQSGQLKESLGGRAARLETRLTDEGVLTRASEGVARFVKDECWHPDKHQGPEGWRYQNKVLAFIPKAQIAAAVQALGEAVGD